MELLTKLKCVDSVATLAVQGVYTLTSTTIGTKL